MPVYARNVSPLVDALAASEPLARLTDQLRESRERFAIVRALLPDALAEQMTAGPVDAGGWTLLAANPSVAAKLRQFVPELQAALEARQRPVTTIRIKVLRA